MIPPVTNPQTGTNDFINTDLGLAFHTDSAFLRGILEKVSPQTMAGAAPAMRSAQGISWRPQRSATTRAVEAWPSNQTASTAPTSISVPAVRPGAFRI